MSKPERRKGKETEEKSEVKAQVPPKKESTEKKEEKVVYEIGTMGLQVSLTHKITLHW